MGFVMVNIGDFAFVVFIDFIVSVRHFGFDRFTVEFFYISGAVSGLQRCRCLGTFSSWDFGAFSGSLTG
jgi:hypothetical protein